MNNLGDFRRVCVQAVRSAGALLLERMGRVQVREKGPADLVTEADLASQELVEKIVLGAFPDHSLLGEEGPHDSATQAEYRWIVDPLDGTSNYVHGYPFFAVSLALEYRGRLLVGAVYNPNADECFVAAAGQGAELNGKPIRVSQVDGIAGAMVTAGLPTRATDGAPDLKVFNRASKCCQSVRRTGSAALNASFVAAGRADVFWSFSTKPWDIAAGALLIQEAGGVVSDPSGAKLDVDRGQIVGAATASLHEEFLAMIRESLES